MEIELGAENTEIAIGTEIEIDATGLTHRELNDAVKNCMVGGGAERIIVRNVYGQRYIGTRLYSCSNSGIKVEIELFGTPGNDLGAFLDGHRIIVHGNAQDGVGNTMDDGEIVVEGRAGDIVGMSMRGGKIFIRDGVGYRAAMHIKEYSGKKPILVIGETAQDFLGEYMAGGIVILLGLGNAKHTANFIGTGMHGGVIYIRGEVEKNQLGKEVGVVELDEKDEAVLEECVSEFIRYFDLGMGKKEILSGKFMKLLPVSKRPYGRIYAY